MTNNLNKIIAANAEQMRVFTDTVKYVIQGCKLVDKKSIKHVSYVFDSFKMIINTVKEMDLLLSAQIFNFQTDSIFKNINEIMNLIKQVTLIKFSNPLILKLKLFYLKFIIKTLYKTINSINKNFTKIQKLSKNFGAGVMVKPILLFFNEIKNVIDTFKMLNLKFIISTKIKLIFFKSFIKSLFSSFSSITNNVDINKISSITLITTILHFIINQFNELLSIIKQFLSFKTVFWLWLWGKKYIKRLRKVIKYINQIINVISEIKFSVNNNMGKIMMDVIKITVILHAVQSLITLIKFIRIPILFKFKVRRLISAVRILRKLIFEIISFTRNIDRGLSGFKLNNSIRILRRIKKLFNLIIDIVKTIIIASIAVMAIIPIAIIFLSGLFALKLVINTTIWLVKSIKFVGVSVFIKLTLFMMLITILMGMGIAFIVFSLLIPFILKSIVLFGAFILGLIGITLMLTVFGGLILLLAPIIPFILIGLVLVSTLIIAIGLIIVLLKVLEIIDLDTKKITKNVKTVLDISKMIIDSIFDSDEKAKEDDKPKPWYESVLNWFGGTISPIIRAVLSIAFLTLIFISIALILMIATSLRLLQILNLDPTQIVTNVEIVIDTAKRVINSLFDSKDDKEDQPSNKNFFLTLMEFFCQPFAMIFGAIMSIGFLALTIVSIALILMIAAELQAIQKLNLDPGKIKDTVTGIVKAAKAVINSIMKPVDSDDEVDSDPKPAKEIFRKILQMVLPTGLSNMIDALMAIGFLALAKSAIGLVGDIAVNLTSILKLPSMEGIEQKVGTIIKTAKYIIGRIINNDDEINKDSVEKFKDVCNNMESMILTINKIGDLSDTVNSLKPININSVSQTQKSFDIVVSLLDSITMKSKSDINTTQRKLNQLSEMQIIIQKFNNVTSTDIKNSEAMLKNYSNFLDKVDNSNLEGLQTTTNLIGKMAELSKSINGDFQGLADALNEKIAPLLEELKKSLEEIKELTQHSETTTWRNNSVENNVQPSKQELYNSVENNVQPSKQELEKKKEQSLMLTNSINDVSSKLSELIDMFENGDARVRTT